MSDPRLVQRGAEVAKMHESAVNRVARGQEKVVSMGSQSKAVDKPPLDCCQL